MCYLYFFSEFNFNLNFNSLVNELPDDLDVLQGTSNDVQQSQSSQDTSMGGSLSQLLSRSTPNSQASMAMSLNSVGGVQTNRGPGMGGMMNMGMSKNSMTNNLVPTLANANKVATSSHIGMNDLVSSASFTIGTNAVMMGGVTNTMSMKPMGTQQMIGSVGSLNMGQQMQNQMMNGPSSFTGNMGQMRNMPSNVNPSASIPMSQTGMMSNPGMQTMQGHQGLPGHPNMNMAQNPGQMVRVSYLQLNIYLHYRTHTFQYLCAFPFFFNIEKAICFISSFKISNMYSIPNNCTVSPEFSLWLCLYLIHLYCVLTLFWYDYKLDYEYTIPDIYFLALNFCYFDYWSHKTGSLYLFSLKKII